MRMRRPSRIARGRYSVSGAHPGKYLQATCREVTFPPPTLAPIKHYYQGIEENPGARAAGKGLRGLDGSCSAKIS